MSDYILPEELLVQILKRLPVDTLLRLRCVSKSWCSLITNPTFITSHINHNINNTHTLVRRHSENHKKEYYTLHCDNDTFDEYMKLDFPFKSTNVYFHILGSCNGLICLSDNLFTYTHDFFVWNPSIRRFVTLPRPNITFSTHGAHTLVSGFGFDPKSNDYKVVRIVYLQGRNGSNKVPPEIELYELSTNTWRGINAVAPPYEICNYSSQVTMNGAVHWVAGNQSRVGGFSSLILAFDMSDEMFLEIMLPRRLADEDLLNMSIGACSESVSLFHYYGGMRSRCCHVWVMKEYNVMNSWSILCTIDLQQGVGLALGSRRNGPILVVTRDGSLVSYNPKTQQTRSLGIHGSAHAFIIFTCSLFVDTYVESLVLLAGTNGVLGHNEAPNYLHVEEDEGDEEELPRTSKDAKRRVVGEVQNQI